MKSNSQRALQIILASVFFLMGCDISTFMLPQQIPTLAPAAIDLIAAQTAAAAAIETAALIPPTPMPTLTPFPTQTLINTLTVTPTFIFLLFSPTDTATPTVTYCDSAVYISDVTIPDGTVESPGASFVKTWALQNTGSCTWNLGYTLNFVSGTRMGGTDTSVGSSITPGGQTQISVTLTAPTTVGEYTGKWRLANDSGEVFGETVAVVINVEVPTATYTPTNTPAPGNTPTPTPSTTVLPTSISTTAVPPTSIPTTAVPPTSIPTTAVPASSTP